MYDFTCENFEIFNFSHLLCYVHGQRLFKFSAYTIWCMMEIEYME